MCCLCSKTVDQLNLIGAPTRKYPPRERGVHDPSPTKLIKDGCKTMSLKAILTLKKFLNQNFIPENVGKYLWVGFAHPRGLSQPQSHHSLSN